MKPERIQKSSKSSNPKDNNRQITEDQSAIFRLQCQLIGQTLKLLRGLREMQAVAAAAGVSVDVWQQWEKGEQWPTPQQAAAALRALERSEADYDRAFLIVAQTEQELRRVEILRKTGVLEFEELANGARSARLGQLVMLDALDRIANRPDLSLVLKITRPQTEDLP